jgi:Fe-S-cluster containining protein
MSSALVVLNDDPRLQLCSICPTPGRCCKEFFIPGLGRGLFQGESWREEAAAQLEREDLPYEPIRAIARTCMPGWVMVVFGCKHVTAEGCCSIYEERPDTCRIFIPTTDELCVFFDGPPLC